MAKMVYHVYNFTNGIDDNIFESLEEAKKYVEEVNTTSNWESAPGRSVFSVNGDYAADLFQYNNYFLVRFDEDYQHEERIFSTLEKAKAYVEDALITKKWERQGDAWVYSCHGDVGLSRVSMRVVD